MLRVDDDGEDMNTMCKAVNDLDGEIGHLTNLVSALRGDLSLMCEQLALLAASVSDMHLVLVPAAGVKNETFDAVSGSWR